ncbi:hypothetical protein ACIBJF_12805 [Streptomyces sp. NPDC050743]|uniref:hypothetical protein n=1 Tax=Streptomyces sp. NPDC050743 TaxID=3365634 RepID=UPI0037A874AA
MSDRTSEPGDERPTGRFRRPPDEDWTPEDMPLGRHTPRDPLPEERLPGEPPPTAGTSRLPGSVGPGRNGLTADDLTPEDTPPVRDEGGMPGDGRMPRGTAGEGRMPGASGMAGGGRMTGEGRMPGESGMSSEPGVAYEGRMPDEGGMRGEGRMPGESRMPVEPLTRPESRMSGESGVPRGEGRMSRGTGLSGVPVEPVTPPESRTSGERGMPPGEGRMPGGVGLPNERGTPAEGRMPDEGRMPGERGAPHEGRVPSEPAARHESRMAGEGGTAYESPMPEDGLGVPSPGDVSARDAHTSESTERDAWPTAPGGTGARGSTVGETAPAPSGTGAPLLSHDETDLWEQRMRQLAVGFVDEPRGAVEQADHVLEEIAGRFEEAVERRRRTLRRSWEASEDRGPGSDTDTEQLRLALRDYQELAGRLLHI